LEEEARIAKLSASSLANKAIANSLSVIASEAKQSRGRSTTVWVAGAAHVVAPGLLRRKGSSQ
jgi:hypothetical protein